MVELTKKNILTFFPDFDRIHFAQLREAIQKAEEGGGMSTIRIGEIQCDPYTEFLGTCICLSLQSIPHKFLGHKTSKAKN